MKLRLLTSNSSTQNICNIQEFWYLYQHITSSLLTRLPAPEVTCRTCPADLVHLLPADLLHAAAEVAQRSPCAAEGLRGQAEGSGVPTGGESDA